MLQQVAEGVLVHQSELLANNTVVVQGREGVLLVDAGITGDEMVCLANDLRELGLPVVAGFSTHPDWDHVLWHAELGEAPRYGTARCAALTRGLLSNADWKTRVAAGLPPEIAEETPLDRYGLITGLPAGTAQIPMSSCRCWTTSPAPTTRSRSTSPGCGCSRLWRTTSTSWSPVTAPSAEVTRYAHGSPGSRVLARPA